MTIFLLNDNISKNLQHKSPSKHATIIICYAAYLWSFTVLFLECCQIVSTQTRTGYRTSLSTFFTEGQLLWEKVAFVICFELLSDVSLVYRQTSEGPQRRQQACVLPDAEYVREGVVGSPAQPSATLGEGRRDEEMEAETGEEEDVSRCCYTFSISFMLYALQ